MYRKIKFRFWDNSFNEFINITATCSLSIKKMIQGKENNIICSQFTGLTDKNGKEIYEGDIVKYYQPYAKRYNTHIVLWDESLACFGLFDIDSEWCKESDWIKIIEIEVLGNIYEKTN